MATKKQPAQPRPPRVPAANTGPNGENLADDAQNPNREQHVSNLEAPLRRMSFDQAVGGSRWYRNAYERSYQSAHGIAPGKRLPHPDPEGAAWGITVAKGGQIAPQRDVEFHQASANHELMEQRTANSISSDVLRERLSSSHLSPEHQAAATELGAGRVYAETGWHPLQRRPFPTGATPMISPEAHQEFYAGAPERVQRARSAWAHEYADENWQHYTPDQRAGQTRAYETAAMSPSAIGMSADKEEQATHEAAALPDERRERVRRANAASPGTPERAEASASAREGWAGTGHSIANATTGMVQKANEIQSGQDPDKVLGSVKTNHYGHDRASEVNWSDPRNHDLKQTGAVDFQMEDAVSGNATRGKKNGERAAAAKGAGVPDISTTEGYDYVNRRVHEAIGRVPGSGGILGRQKIGQSNIWRVQKDTNELNGRAQNRSRRAKHTRSGDGASEVQ